MSFEQPFYSFSYPSGPPTPGITPKSASFGKDPFGSPVQESNFFDPRFSPANPYAASPEFLKTPKISSFTTPTRSPTFTRGIKRPFPGHDVESEIATHVHHLSPNPNLPLPPVEPSRQLTSSPILSTSSKKTDGNANAMKSQEIEISKNQTSSMHSASSMQTPPPTSTSASKRKAQQVQVAKLVKESAVNGGRKTTPIFPKPSNAAVSTSPVEASPQQFSSIQFSPEVFGSFSMAGPATAPVYPQQKLFWDANQDSNAMNIDFGNTDTLADSFGLDASKQMQSFASNNDLMAMSQIVSSFDADNTMGLAMPVTASAVHQTNYLSSAGLITNGSRSKLPNMAVDPSLLFSSPSRATTQPVMDLPHQNMQNNNLQPYAHQIREAQRERESSETRRSKRRRGPPTESPAVKAALETLRWEEEDRSCESLKACGSNKLSRRDTNSNRAAFEKPEAQSIKVPKRTSIRTGRGLGRHPSSQRQSAPKVTLSIDPDGRAKTETQAVPETNLESKMDVDSDSGDTESLSSEDGAYMVTSRPPSFAYPNQKPSVPRRGIFASSGSTAHSPKSSYASTQANLIDPALNSTFIVGPLLDSRGAESEAETVVDSDNERGDAQSELKKIVKHRAQQWPSEQSREGMPNRRMYAGNVYGTQQASTLTQDMFSNISPTTITDPDLATPSSARDSIISGGSTRCVCHNSEADGEFMIMCESCRKWLHVRCIGLNPQKIPNVYLCVFCTGQTPNVRGGRVREPARAAFPAPSSPLAHKSHRFR